ncbi:hypothetical protein GCM10011613_30860 [Cellvibrio zantedeschiae]|uniref:Acyltransferase 3 domain-containing protein n=1 Tax=Cellvibrio zantedeschiae TaxID=1237077 RepID=A0ABQ3BC96_9GAMM|nr:acyltransferase family protein [Cellvibrio zantedeschiae]GGY83784.1 hypothetical protein GCM10011613_30860 [Cellvibrio zantedeschiae]
MNSTVESRPYEVPVADALMSDTRLHYMDNLRAIAMLAGVLFHAALAHSVLLHNVWLPANAEQSQWVDVFAWFSHLFRMPLFFVIAGFFAALLVQKRGVGRMLKNRAVRILLPLVIFLPLCMWAVIAGLFDALAHVQNKSPVLLMIANAAPGTPPPPPTTLHLWFLYNLLFFYLITWILCQFQWGKLSEFFKRVKPWQFICVFPLIMVPALSSVNVPMPAPDSFFPQLWSFGFFGIFFLLGYWIFSAENFIEKFQPYWKLLLVLSLVAYGIFYTLIPKEFSMVPAPMVLWKKIIVSLCEAYVAVWMTLVCLTLGKTWLNSHSKFMRLIADSSYWIYIIHLPLLFALQYQLMDKNWSLFAKFSVASGVTLAIGFVTYLLLVRWTPIGWMLNGRRK